MKSAEINYKEIQFHFFAYRKHFIKNTRYHVYLIPKFLVLSAVSFLSNLYYLGVRIIMSKVQTCIKPLKSYTLET